jgi:hypothetical protein
MDIYMQVHLVTKEIWNVAMALYPYLPVWVIDKLVLLMCAVVFGDTSRHGLRRPAIGPFTMKCTTPVYPVVDVGTYAKIRSGEVRVLPAAVKGVRGNVVEFSDGRQYPFDAVVFATGYRCTVRKWLKVKISIELYIARAHMCIMHGIWFEHTRAPHYSSLVMISAPSLGGQSASAQCSLRGAPP